jgi:hypothetical protein
VPASVTVLTRTGAATELHELRGGRPRAHRAVRVDGSRAHVARDAVQADLLEQLVAVHDRVGRANLLTGTPDHLGARPAEEPAEGVVGLVDEPVSGSDSTKPVALACKTISTRCSVSASIDSGYCAARAAFVRPSSPRIPESPTTCRGRHRASS